MMTDMLGSTNGFKLAIAVALVFVAAIYWGVNALLSKSKRYRELTDLDSDED